MNNFAMTSLAVLMGAIAAPAIADQTGCDAVFNGELRIWNTPYHLYMTMDKTKGESINSGKTLYLLSDGKWSVSKITNEQMLAMGKDTIKNGKAVCKVIRDELIDGVATTLYSIHQVVDDTATDGNVWISKASGLPVHMKMEDFEQRFEYTGVVAPHVD